MKDKFVESKYGSYIPALVLSANDVVATVFILDEDAEGTAIKTVADVDLPFEAWNYRAKNPEGKSLFQRGEVIEIRCEISKRLRRGKTAKISDKGIEQMLAGMFDVEDENAGLFDQINRRTKQFSVEWANLCKRHLKERKTRKQK